VSVAISSPGFGLEEPFCDPRFGSVRRIRLIEGAWVDYAPGWLRRDGQLFDVLLRDVSWRGEERALPGRVVTIPRLHASLVGKRLHPVIDGMRQWLQLRYGTAFDSTTVALYRDGNDSVAWHSDIVAPGQSMMLVATVSLGYPRTFLLRHKGGGSSQTLSLGRGDLMVMGGSCQRLYQHALPEAAHAGARIALMYRTSAPR
jgi:alkylated DNA repair dioxygenase AlkB